MCVLFQMVVRMFAVCRWEWDDVKNTFLHLHGPSWSCLCDMSIHPKCSVHKSLNKTWQKIWDRAYIHMMGRVSSVITIRYRLGSPGIKSGGGFLHTSPDWPWGLPSLLYNGYRVFPRCKAAEAWHWPPTPSSAKVEERVELYLYSPLGLHGLSRVNYTFTLPYKHVQT